jgi:hypothetical protein
MRNIVFFSLLFLFSSCIRGWEQPRWIFDQPSDTNKIYGVGQSYSILDAKQIALEDVASKLSLIVSSKTSSSISRSGNFLTDGFSSNIDTEVGKIKFNNYVVEKSEKISDSYAVMVSVDKAKLFTEKKTQVDNIISSSAKLYNSLSGKNILEERDGLVKINNDMNEMINLSYILFALNSSYNLDNSLMIASDYKQKYNDLMSSLSVVVEENSDPAVRKIIIDLLNSRGFTVVANNHSQNSKIAYIKIQNSTVKDKIYNGYGVNLTINLNIGSQEKIINSNTVQVGGTSSISYDEALNSALGALKAKVKNDGFESVFGMKQIQ